MYEDNRLSSFRYYLTHFLIFILFRSAVSLVLEGPNVCTRREPYETTDKIISLWRNITTYKWCWEVPFLCPRIKTVEEGANQTQIKWEPVEECCNGYVKHETRNICIPVCSPNCLRGKCVAPNICECEVGYGGSSCDKNFYIFETNSDFKLQRLVERRDDSNSQREGEILLLVQMLAVLLAVVIFALWVYYSRKVSKLETKLTQIQLMVDGRNSSSGQHQFDNIAYICGAESLTDADGYSLVKDSRDRHRQSNPKQFKRRKHSSLNDNQLNYVIDASGRKKRYLRIRDFREHLYAEIRDQGLEDQYDHLNFVRPGTSPRSGYQNLARSFNENRSRLFSETEGSRNFDDIPTQQRRLDILINLG